MSLQKLFAESMKSFPEVSSLRSPYERGERQESYGRHHRRSASDIRMETSTAGRSDRSDVIAVSIWQIRIQGTAGTAALSLKLSEIELVKQVIHDTPVLLLDDVLSELDHNRQNYLLDSIHDIQTMITCTGLDEFVNHRFSINRVFRVVEGVRTAEIRNLK